MQRGDTYLAIVDPVTGSEQAGTRPVIVVSRNVIHQLMEIVVVVPVTGQENRPRVFASQVPIAAGLGGLAKDSVALAEQVRTISKQRLRRRMGSLPAELMAALDLALKDTLDLE